MAVRVVVVDYDPEWPHLFEQIRAAVQAAVGDLALAIEHVGSTAVPGLAAKPIVDVDVVVRAADVGETVRRVALIGYGREGDLGISGRQAFISPIGAPAQHLYLCPENSPALEAHLRFRDYLRANQEPQPNTVG